MRIKPIFTNSRPKTSNPVLKTHKSAKTRLAELLPLTLLVAVPLSVHAGVFSSVIEILQPEETIEPVSDTSSDIHEAATLHAALHSDPQAAKGGGDVIVEEGALVSTGTVAPDEVAKTAGTGEISVYTVREGDTPSQIAEMFGISVNTIFWANDIKNNVLQPGETLVILPITGVRHIVKEGETLSTIAKKYEGDVEEILAYNQLSDESSIAVGDTVVIPNGEMHSAPKQKTASAQPVSVSGASGESASGLTHPVPGARRSQGIHGYNGVDLAAPAGTAIRAAAAGEVIVSKSSGWNGGYGNYIVIKHANGVQTLYAHNSENYVGVGAYVAQGEVIGAVGNTGKSTGSHVHFEVRGAKNPF